jgi:hypothetical protein
MLPAQRIHAAQQGKKIEGRRIGLHRCEELVQGRFGGRVGCRRIHAVAR